MVKLQVKNCKLKNLPLVRTVAIDFHCSGYGNKNEWKAYLVFKFLVSILYTKYKKRLSKNHTI